MCYVVGLSSPNKVKKFLIFFVPEGERGRIFAVFPALFLQKGILDFIAHRPIIQVFTVYKCRHLGISQMHQINPLLSVQSNHNQLQ